MPIWLKCKFCNEEFHLSPAFVLSTGNFCSRKCFAIWQTNHTQAQNNAFYGKKHTLESRLKISKA